MVRSELLFNVAALKVVATHLSQSPVRQYSVRRSHLSCIGPFDTRCIAVVGMSSTRISGLDLLVRNRRSTIGHYK